MPVVVTSSLIRREVRENTAILTFDRPNSGANIFDAATMTELNEHLDFVEEQSSLHGLVIGSAKKSIFIAGADLKTLLKQAETGEMREFIAFGQRVFNRLAGLKIPTCAAIHGACAGGGYEVTLACDYRIASEDPSTRIGLPETTLGLVPAWGGCTRLPRLIGPERAAEVILKGKLHSARECLEMGLVDEVTAPDRLIEAAQKKLSGGKRESVKLQGQITSPAKSPPPQLEGNQAPERALAVISAGLPKTIDESLGLELDAIVDLGNTEATRNLIRNFFLAEKYKRGTSKAAAEKIVHAAVIGAGVMGSGIAQWLSSRGVTVILRDVGREQLDRGLANIEKIFSDAVKRGILTEEKAKQGRARIVASSAPMELRAVAIVIEAASEKLEIKKQIFRELGDKVKPNAILATNTSALPISDLAAQTGHAERVIGLHFFNPVSRMKLIEVVIGKETSDETKERGLGFARQIGKLPVLVRDRPGFLVNRVLFPYLLDAAELFARGMDAEQIDRPLLEWGMPMGPLRLIDEIGIDITEDIANTLFGAYGRRDQAPELLHQMRTAGALGRKSGAGFYKYEGKQQTPNSALQRLAAAPASTADANLPNRLVFLMVNEAANCLEEDVVASPEDADYGMILGTGFAPFRGGPLRFADHFGLKKVVAELERLAEKEEKFGPCDLLMKHARDGTTFYQT